MPGIVGLWRSLHWNLFNLPLRAWIGRSHLKKAATTPGTIAVPCLNRLFKHPEALKSFWKSLEYRVPNPNAWYGLACTYALMNNPDATAIHLRQATEFNPNIYSLMARNDISFDLVRDHPKVRMILCN